jgi:hypothetical protein
VHVVDDARPSNVLKVRTLYVLWRTPLLNDAEMPVDQLDRSALSHDSQTLQCMHVQVSNVDGAALISWREHNARHDCELVRCAEAGWPAAARSHAGWSERRANKA